MKDRKKIIFLVIILLAIGFAAVSTTLIINGTANFNANEEDFKTNIIFTKSVLDDVDVSTETIVDAGKQIIFETKELSKVGDKSVLVYTVTNNSSQYGADATVTANIEHNQYVTLENEPNNFILNPGESSVGTLTLTLVNSSIDIREVPVELEIDFKPIETTGDIEKYTVSLDPSGGLYNGSDIAVEKVVVSGSVFSLKNVSREGYFLSHWLVNGEVYSGDEITINSNTTISAVWVTEDEIVAKIGETSYASIQSAFKAAKANDVIVLLKDVTETATNEKTVTLNLNSKKITGSLLNKGNLTITKGTIENTSGTAIVNEGTLTLGINDVEVSTDSLAIIGTNIGIEQLGTLNFYDGYVEAVVGINGGYDSIPDGYNLYVEHNNVKNCQKVYLTANVETAVVKTVTDGVIYYNNLQDAIKSTEVSNETMYAIRDFEAAYELSVDEGRSATFDIQGKAVEFGNVVTNNGTFNLIDTGSEKGSLSTSIAMMNNGTLNIDEVIINATTSDNIIENSNVINIKKSVLTALDGYALYNISGTTITLDNDTYLKANKYAFYNKSAEETTILNGNIQGIYNEGDNTNIIFDGTVNATSSGTNYVIYNRSGNMNIKEGNYESSTTSNVIYNAGALKIDGGNFNNTNTTLSTKVAVYNTKKLEINGGTFDATSYAVLSINSDAIVNINGGELSGDIYGVINNCSNFTINDGKITGPTAVYNGACGYYYSSTPIQINGGNIIGDTYGIHVAYNTVIVAGGNVYGGTYGAYINSTRGLIIGDSSNEVDDKNPIIEGETYGVYSDNGTIEFYDGILKGKTAGYYGEITKNQDAYTVSSGTEIINDEVINTNYLVENEYFVTVDGKEYNSLNKAIDSVSENGTLKIIKNASINSETLIPSGKEITIDLNGKELSNVQQITNEGDFIIEDTSTEKNGILSGDSKYLIYSTGNFTLKSGTIKNESSVSEVTGVYNDSTGDVTIIGGAIDVKSTSNAAIAVRNNQKDMNMLIENAKISSYSSKGQSMGVYVYYGKLTVKNSEIIASNEYVRNSNSYACYGIQMGIHSSFNINNSKVSANSTGIIAKAIESSSNGINYVTNSELVANSTQKFSYIIYNSTGTVNFENNTMSVSSGVSSNSGGLYNYSAGIINSTNDTITSNNVYCVYGYSGTINIVDANFTSENKGCIYVAGNNTVNVISGNITGATHGIEVTNHNANILNIGNSSTDVSANDPIIRGNNYGIYISGGKVSFYDGILKGVDGSYYGEITALPDSYMVTTETETDNGTEYIKSYLTKQANFLKVGETEYNSFSSAIEAIETEGTIEVINSIAVGENITFPQGKNIKLDLAGYTIELSQQVTVEGDLTITDSSESSTGMLIGGSSYLIYVTGNFTLEDGTLKNDSTTVATYGVYNYGKGNINLLGGKIETSSTGNGSYSVYNVTTGNVVVDNCEISASSNRSVASGIYMNSGIANITNSTISSYYDYSTTSLYYLGIGAYFGSASTFNIDNSNISAYSTGATAKAIETTSKNNNTIKNSKLSATSELRTAYLFYNSTGTIDVTNTEMNVSTSGNNLSKGVFNYSGGIINLNDSTVVAQDGSAISGNSGIINVNGGKYSSLTNSAVAIQGYSTVAINSGIIEGAVYGVYLSNYLSNKLTIGVKDGTVDNESPIIKGSTYGVYYEGGTVDFYDGTIKGTVSGIYGVVSSYEDGYQMTSGSEVKEGETYYTNYLVELENFITNNGKYYNNLQTAIDEAVTGDKVEIIASAPVYHEVTIPATLDVTIDLNGYNLTMTKRVLNNGTLKVINTNENNKSLIDAYLITELFTNKGDLELSNISIKCSMTNQYTVSNDSNKNLTVNNVDITSKYGIKNYYGNLIATDTNLETTERSIDNYGSVSYVGGSIIGTKYAIYSNSKLDETYKNVKIVSTTNSIYKTGTSNMETDNITIEGLITNNTAAVLNIANSEINARFINKGTSLFSKNILTTTSTYTSSNYYYGIENNGTLEVIDSEINLSKDNNYNSHLAGISHSIANSNLSIYNSTINIDNPYDVGKTYGIYALNGSTSAANTFDFKDSKVLVNGGSETYGVYISVEGAIANIESGEIKANGNKTSYGIYINKGDITLGIKEDGTVSVASPYVEAIGTTSGIGIKKVNGYLRYFDGKIVGSTNAKPDTTTEVEYLYEVKTEIDSETGYEYCILEVME